MKIAICNKMNESQMHYAKGNKPDSKGDTLIRLIQHCQKAKLWECRTNLWLPGVRGEDIFWLQTGILREFFRLLRMMKRSVARLR